MQDVQTGPCMFRKSDLELPKEGAAAEEDAAAQSVVAALLGRDRRLAIPTSWRRPRRDSVAPRGGSGKGGAGKMGKVEDSEAAERLKILKVPKGSAD